MVSATATITRPRLRVNTHEHRMDRRVLRTSVVDTECDHSNISVFRSSQLEIHVHSPSVKMVDRGGYGASRPLPLFTDRDQIKGTVHLDHKLNATLGRLTITMEGAFIFISPTERLHQDIRQHRHLFYNASMSFSTGESGSPRSSALREAFTAVRHRNKMDRKPSVPDVSTHAGPSTHAFPFAFDIPRSSRPGEEMPSTFSTISMGEICTRGRTGVERAEVEYMITALWEGPDPNERAKVNATILYEPDSDFQSLDGLSVEPDMWLEIPLRSDRPVPFKCAITLPIPSTFSRSSSIPYFAIFTTKPRSTLLAREIAVDATIAVSLLREVRVDSSRSTLSHVSIPSVSSSSLSNEDLNASSPSKRRFLLRIHKSTPMFGSGRSSPGDPSTPIKEKPLPVLPPLHSPGVLETRTLHTDVSIGFPKRPRGRVEPHQKHPTLNAHTSLPDGLYKGKMQLDKSMLPSIDWAGLSVKYFLDVSVLFGQDQCRARIPVRII